MVRVCASQTAPLQQPPGHDAAVHTHVPPMHAWPCVHILPPPQEHVPAVHPSADGAPHAWQASPPVPHEPVPDFWQLPSLAQHPLGHEAALQTHLPPMHCWPEPHGSDELPHSHAPLAQLSATKVLHAVHASPEMPQALVERALHVGPEQQPPVHVCEQPVQAPTEQLSPPGQLWHWLPPLPQAPSVLPGWQTLPAQHPVGQVVPSQTQPPLRQRWPS